MVTIYGEVIKSDSRRILLSVASQLGDARSLGLVGQLWLPLNQITFARDPATELERVRVPYALADYLSKSCQPCD